MAATTFASLPLLHVGRGARLGPVTWFPLWTGEPAGDDVRTGAAADLEVTEMPGHPDVEHLTVTNLSGGPVLLVEGELLEGGWQHRVVRHDVIAEAGRSLVVDVNCVEAGRWDAAAPGHRRRARRASPRVRAALHAAPAPSRQEEVWQRVAAYGEALGPSATSSLLDHVDRFAAEPTDAPVVPADSRALPGQRGVAYGVGGYPVGLEVFSSTEALQAHLGEILASALFDARTLGGPSAGGEVPGRRVRRLVAHLDAVRATSDPAAGGGGGGGGGELMAADTHKVLARGIRWADRWVHLSVFDRRHPLLGLAA